MIAEVSPAVILPVTLPVTLPRTLPATLQPTVAQAGRCGLAKAGHRGRQGHSTKADTT